MTQGGELARQRVGSPPAAAHPRQSDPENDAQKGAQHGEHAQGEQHGLVPGHSSRPYRPRTIRRIRSQRSFTAASAPRAVGR